MTDFKLKIKIKSLQYTVILLKIIKQQAPCST